MTSLPVAFGLTHVIIVLGLYDVKPPNVIGDPIPLLIALCIFAVAEIAALICGFIAMDRGRDPIVGLIALLTVVLGPIIMLKIIANY